MSDAVEERLVTLLDDPHISPYGNPIPPAETPAATPLAGGTPADEVSAEANSVTLARLTETVQNEPELMVQLRDAGIVPGAALTVTVGDDLVTVTGPKGTVSVPGPLAAGLRVHGA